MECSDEGYIVFWEVQAAKQPLPYLYVKGPFEIVDSDHLYPAPPITVRQFFFEFGQKGPEALVLSLP